MVDLSPFSRSEPIYSPLDPFLCQFLRAVQRSPKGYLPTTDRAPVAEALDWPVDFCDGIHISAQARGLVERAPIGHNRRRVVWVVSTRGRIWLDLVSGGPTLAPETTPLAVIATA